MINAKSNSQEDPYNSFSATEYSRASDADPVGRRNETNIFKLFYYFFEIKNMQQ